MFHAAGSSFDFDCLNKQQLLQRYDSEEEDVSECEVGQDNSFSPVDFQRCDSADVSTDELSTVDSEGSDFSHLLAYHHQPSDCRGSRPVSTMTIKQQNSEDNFRPGSCIYQQDDEMILELPTPETMISPHLRSSTYLQPGDYDEDSLRSLSPASCLSDDDSDVCVAEQVTYMEPTARPSLIQISPTTSEASSRFCTDSSTNLAEHEEEEEQQQQQQQQQQQPEKTSSSFSSPTSTFRRRSVELFRRATSSKRTPIDDSNDNEEKEEEQGPSATINCLSEVPLVPCPMSPRSQSVSLLARPQTAGSEQSPSGPPAAMQTRFPNRSIRRPPSLMSVNNFHFPFWPARAASPRVVEGTQPHHHVRSNSYSPCVDQSLSLMASPVPLSRNPSISGTGSGSMPTRNPTVKHTAAASVGSCSTTCWSDVDGQATIATPETEKTEHTTGSGSGSGRKKSLRHGKPDGEKSGKSFLGLRLGKRKSVVRPVS